MRRQKPDARLVCYASVIVLSLSACSQHGGKSKSPPTITDNTQPASTADYKKSRLSQGGRWLRKRGGALTSASSQYDNLWDRLFDLYDLPPIEHEEIDRELNWFINHPDYIARVQDRAEPFLYSIVKQVEKHDIPGEIALLPVIESAFKPHAVSPANAAGIWQFIPSTGRIYGLKRSRSYDGRRDVYASTKAAIKYLKKLHREFNGDWLLAIAAYNCGEGAVGRAVQRNMARSLPTDFWSLDLPRETRSYVPRLLAVSKLFLDADQYGIDLHPIPNVAQYKPVKVNTQIDLALAADAANISLDKLQELNPGFKGRWTDIEGSYHLFIPAERKAAEFRQEVERLAQESRSSSRYQPPMEALAGDVETPSAVRVAAVETNVPVREDKFERRDPPPPSREPADERDLLKEWVAIPETEPERERVVVPDTRPVKERAALPERKPVRENFTRSAERTTPISRPPVQSREPLRERRTLELASGQDKTADRWAKKTSYTVLPGETLWAVARKHAVDVGQLAKWNNFSENTRVQAGQNVLVWNKDAAKKLPPVNAGIRPSQSIKYTVREGDTLFSISRRFRVSVAELRKWNGSQVEKQMLPGRNITVQKDKD